MLPRLANLLDVYRRGASFPKQLLGTRLKSKSPRRGPPSRTPPAWEKAEAEGGVRVLRGVAKCGTRGRERRKEESERAIVGSGGQRSGGQLLVSLVLTSDTEAVSRSLPCPR